MEEKDLLDHPTEYRPKKTRPAAITVICVLGFIGAAITVPIIFTDIAADIGSWYPPYLGFTSLVGLTCMVGLWNMKKWAAYIYTGMVALGQVVLIAMDLWNIVSLILPGVVIAIVFAHFDKLD